VEFVFEFVGQGGFSGFTDLTDDAGDEVSGADKGAEDVYALVGEGSFELLFQNVIDAADHEVDDRLRRVDDAVGVDFLGRESLKEALVDGIEERLLFAVVLFVIGGAFKSLVETVEFAEKLVAAEDSRGHGLDDLFDFTGDDVTVAELLGVEDTAEDALGEKVLNEHLLDSGLREVRIDGVPAEQVEALEAIAEFAVTIFLGLDQVLGALGEFGDAPLELGYG
jgi:hypothetical protein